MARPVLRSRRVGATRINHVSIRAADLEQSARFYEQLFGLERVPTARFAEPVVWLRVGDQQLHLFARGEDVPRYHHLAFDVDDFETVYLKAKEMGLLDPNTFGAQVREHPAGWVQMYIRDPGGNLIEIDSPDAAAIDRSIVTDIEKLEDATPQTGESREATLYHTHGAVR
jgi:lactoylglutathione lyase